MYSVQAEHLPLVGFFGHPCTHSRTRMIPNDDDVFFSGVFHVEWKDLCSKGK